MRPRPRHGDVEHPSLFGVFAIEDRLLHEFGHKGRTFAKVGHDETARLLEQRDIANLVPFPVERGQHDGIELEALRLVDGHDLDRWGSFVENGCVSLTVGDALDFADSLGELQRTQMALARCDRDELPGVHQGLTPTGSSGQSDEVRAAREELAQGLPRRQSVGAREQRLVPSKKLPNPGGVLRHRRLEIGQRLEHFALHREHRDRVHAEFHGRPPKHRHHGEVVVGVGQNAHRVGQVANFEPGVELLCATDHLARQPEILERRLDRRTLSVRVRQHGNLGRSQAFVHQFANPSRSLSRVECSRPPELDPIVGRRLCQRVAFRLPHRYISRLLDLLEHLVHKRENAFLGTVVGREPVRLEFGLQRLEQQGLGVPKAVNGLLRVADKHQRVWIERANEAMLQGVHVLRFVHQNAPVPFLKLAARLVRGLEQLDRAQFERREVQLLRPLHLIVQGPPRFDRKVRQSARLLRGQNRIALGTGPRYARHSFEPQLGRLLHPLEEGHRRIQGLVALTPGRMERLERHGLPEGLQAFRVAVESLEFVKVQTL